MSASLRLDDFWDPCGTTVRRGYALAGCGLMAVKFGLDRARRALDGRRRLGLVELLESIRAIPRRSLRRPDGVCRAPARAGAAAHRHGRGVDAATAARRGLAALARRAVFFPALNLVLFTMLCLTPTRGQRREEPAGRTGFLAWLARVLVLKNPASSAVVAIVLTVAMVTPPTAALARGLMAELVGLSRAHHSRARARAHSHRGRMRPANRRALNAARAWRRPGANFAPHSRPNSTPNPSRPRIPPNHNVT